MKNFTKIDLPIYPLYQTFEAMLISEKLVWNRHSQFCINSVPGHTDNYLYGAASLAYDWEKEIILPNGDIQVPERDVALKEEDFTEICDVFKGTVFEELYDVLKNTYKLGRVRIMSSKPKTCLTWHTDPSMRLHFPMKTQEGCYMVIQDEVLHLEQDQWYLTNTTVPHTAFNGSKQNRVHLVAAILD